MTGLIPVPAQSEVDDEAPSRFQVQRLSARLSSGL